MAAVDKTQMDKTALAALQTEIVSTFEGADEMLRLLPRVPMQGSSILVNQELALGDGEYVANDGSITPAVYTYTQTAYKWKTALRDIDLPRQVNRTNSGIVDQIQEAMRIAVKSVARIVSNKIVTGDEGGTAAEVDGLDSLIADAPWSSQIVYAGADSTTPATISFSKLDELIDKANLADLSQSILVMPRRTRRSIRNLYASMGGAQPEYIERANMRFMAYSGIPIVVNDYMGVTFDDSTAGGNNESRIYLISVEPVAGACLFVPATPGTAENELGMEIVYIPHLEGKNNAKVRAVMDHGFAVRGSKHFACLKNCTN